MIKNLFAIINVILIISSILSLNGCTIVSVKSYSSPLVDDGRFIKHTLKNEKIIVFVHGVGGDNKSTWTNESKKVYFPELIAENKDLADFDVFVASYYKSKNNKNANIYELAHQLNDTLEKYRILPKSDSNTNTAAYKKVYFVVHSMGNLVIRTALIQRTDFDQNKLDIPLIVSFASPSKGSQYVDFAKNVNSVIKTSTLAELKSQLNNMKKVEENSFLSLLNSDWTRRPLDTEIACAYEKKSVIPLIPVVVSKDSASAVCTRSELKALDEDHFSIVKPASSNAEPVIWLKEQLTKESTKKGWELERWKEKRIIIGAKDYPESNIQAAMIALVLEDQLPNFTIERKYNNGDGFRLFSQLKREDIDIYPEYSGSMIFAYLDNKPSEFNAILNNDKSVIENHHHIETLNKMMSDTGFKMAFYSQSESSSPFQLVMLKSQAKKIGMPPKDVINLSEFSSFSNQCEIGGETGFFYRNDGYVGLISYYKQEQLNFKDIHYYKHIDSYKALDDSEKQNKCLVIVGYGTDPELFDQKATNSYVKIIDDKGFFPIHYPGTLAHGFLDKKFPQIKNIIADKLTGIITTEEMAELNRKGNLIWETKFGAERYCALEELAKDFLLKKDKLSHDAIKNKANCSGLLSSNWSM